MSKKDILNNLYLIAILLIYLIPFTLHLINALFSDIIIDVFVILLIIDVFFKCFQIIFLWKRIEINVDLITCDLTSSEFVNMKRKFTSALNLISYISVLICIYFNFSIFNCQNNRDLCILYNVMSIVGKFMPIIIIFYFLYNRFITCLT